MLQRIPAGHKVIHFVAEVFSAGEFDQNCKE